MNEQDAAKTPPPARTSGNLVRCVSCGEPVAFAAKTCSKCGEPRPSTPRWAWPAAFLAALILWSIVKSTGFAG
jgi:hypothetical protein